MNEEEYNKLSLKLQKRYMKTTYYNEREEIEVIYVMCYPPSSELWDMWDKIYSLDMDT